LGDPRVIRPRGRHGFGFHAQWNDDFHHALHTVLTDESQGYYRDFGGLSDLAHVFRRPYLFTRRFSPHRQRSHGRPVDDLEASSFLAYSQNHDQVGNRATGERLHHLLSPDDAKIAAALAILSPYVPMLFQGEEWAASSPFQYFVDFSEDPKLARAVSEGRRKEFAEFLNNGEVPNPQDEETFLRSKLAWEELLEPQHREMLDWYKRLIGVRRRIPALVDGRLDRVRTRYDERAKWLAVERENTILAANLGTRACTIKTQPLDRPEVLLASKAEVQLEGTALRLPAHSVALACGAVHPTLPSGAAAISLHPNVRSSGAHENVGHR
jgi:maltooligosyltrehalose trehalohydrolase